MAEKKEARIRDLTDTVREITGLVKENYLNGLRLTGSCTVIRSTLYKNTSIVTYVL